eukprot:CAMPEP_0195001290 /NCGR_PEP_ID=MMETSP0326_2-20130528/1233_1 /TAXON_ID=2866 ORGANISM="Crypthecodinium cohnii, Strain Seligo" /NCGR_SAMPLE_ID=MMETSP0326_2 /ASSEMBLY_ACC=CAM_ASM_000348 /LENGTH=75 /DNA_ID=CAMNT_0040003675 /DNA_START=183 /DNA_END=410 /DNA_ORIENTATION=+
MRRAEVGCGAGKQQEGVHLVVVVMVRTRRCSEAQEKSEDALTAQHRQHILQQSTAEIANCKREEEGLLDTNNIKV